MLKINVITQLIIFMIMAILINLMKLEVLLALLAIIAILLAIKRNHLFLKTLKRFRWLFIVLMIIYIFNTPGEHIQNWPLVLSPTYEGIFAGLTQAMRISLVLAMISWIMAVNTKQELVSGFYFILLPLKLIGLEADRFAARLWLTLHYVELNSQSKNKETLMDKLNNITKLESQNTLALMRQQNNSDLNCNDFDVIVFMMPKFLFTDYFAITVIILIVVRVIF